MARPCKKMVNNKVIIYQMKCVIVGGNLFALKVHNKHTERYNDKELDSYLLKFFTDQS